MKMCCFPEPAQGPKLGYTEHLSEVERQTTRVSVLHPLRPPDRGSLRVGRRHHDWARGIPELLRESELNWFGLNQDVIGHCCEIHRGSRLADAALLAAYSVNLRVVGRAVSCSWHSAPLLRVLPEDRLPVLRTTPMLEVGLSIHGHDTRPAANPTGLTAVNRPRSRTVRRSALAGRGISDRSCATST